MSSYCPFSWKIWKHVLTCRLRLHFWHEFCNFSHKQHISKVSSWWDNDLTHHISLFQPLYDPMLDENQHWWRVALIVWSWYSRCVHWNLSAVLFHNTRYDTAVTCMQMQYWWHLWPIANTTFSHELLASNRFISVQIFSSSKVTLNCRLFLFLLAYLLVS